MFLSILLVGVGLLGTPNIANADWEQQVLEPDHALCIIIGDCVKDWILEINFYLSSGPSIDIYLCEGAITLLLGPPSEYISRRDNAVSEKWTYEIPDDGTYSVVFLNDQSETVTLHYNIELNPFGSFPFWLILPAAAVGIVMLVVGIVIFYIIRRREARELPDEGA